MTEAEKKVLIYVSKGKMIKQIPAYLTDQYKKNGWSISEAPKGKVVRDGG